MGVRKPARLHPTPTPQSYDRALCLGTHGDAGWSQSPKRRVSAVRPHLANLLGTGIALALCLVPDGEEGSVLLLRIQGSQTM